MTYQQLDKIADLTNPFFALALLITAIGVHKASSWAFILRCVLAFALVQPIAKFLQRSELVTSDFPSTHFAVALCLATSFFVLGGRFIFVSVLVPLFYGALMLYQKYHTPLEMIGAVYAVPLTVLVHRIGMRKVSHTEANSSERTGSEVVTN